MAIVIEINGKRQHQWLQTEDSEVVDMYGQTSVHEAFTCQVCGAYAVSATPKNQDNVFMNIISEHGHECEVKYGTAWIIE